MKLQFEENEYYLMKDGEDLAIATTDESFIKELGAERLSLKNCEAIKNGYDLDKLANEYANPYGDYDGHFGNSGFINGFQKAIELLGDKKFSGEDIRKALSAGLSIGYGRQFEIENKQVEIDSYIKSLQQTEWDVEVEMYSFFPNLPKRGEHKPVVKPKLDVNGCLILKIK